jgi:hypothetical protein
MSVIRFTRLCDSIPNTGLASRKGPVEVPRRLAGSEPGVTPIDRPLQVYGNAINGSDLSENARHVYRVLADHVNHTEKPYTGDVWPGKELIAASMGGVHKKTVERGLNELLRKKWICLPEGDSGGRRKRVPEPIPRGNLIHMHREPCDCYRAAPLKQRQAWNSFTAEKKQLVIERRKATKLARQKRDARKLLGLPADEEISPHSDNLSTFRGERLLTGREAKVDKLRLIEAVKVDKPVSAYKEELLNHITSLPTSSTVASVARHDGAGKPSSDPTNADRYWIDKIECELSQRLGMAVVSISKDLKDLGITWKQLFFLWKQNRGKLNRVGGLVEFVRKYPSSKDHLFRPKCFACGDSGVIENEAAQRDETLRCECPAGQTKQNSKKSPYDPTQLREHLLNAAADLRWEDSSFSDITEVLEEYAERSGEFVNDVDDLERRLTALEREMVSRMRARQTDADLYSLRASIEPNLKPYRGKMTRDQLAVLEHRHLESALLARANLPRLSLFYMHSRDQPVGQATEPLSRAA